MRLYIGYVEHYVVIQPYDAAEVFFKSPPALTEGRLLLVAIAKQHLCPDCFKGVTPPNSIGNLDQPVHGLGVTVRNLEIEVVENRVMPVSNRGGKFIEVRHQLEDYRPVHHTRSRTAFRPLPCVAARHQRTFL